MNKFQHLLASKMIRDHYSNMIHIAKHIISEKDPYNKFNCTINENFCASNLFHDNSRYWFTMIHTHYARIGEIYALIRNALNSYAKDNKLKLHFSMEYEEHKTYCFRLFIYDNEVFYSNT